MSAVILREAAAKMREDFPWDQVGSEFHAAVADWLEDQRNAYESNEAIWRVSSLEPENRWTERGLTVEANLEHHHGHALTVARAYLGESA